MELLIELVEKRKLLINDISLAAVTDEYMQTVSAMQELSLPNTAQFVTLAATLLLIKSKSLLPVLDLTEEEEASIDDLEERLRRYQIVRDAATVLKESFGKTRLYEPEYLPPRDPLFLPDLHCTIPALQKSMLETLAGLPKIVSKPTAKVKSVVSLEEMIKKLQDRIEREMKITFSRLRATETEHGNIIVSFLAILELCKQGNVVATQVSRFEDITLEASKVTIPRYY